MVVWGAANGKRSDPSDLVIGGSMPGIVHGGSLGRWFEELCRIKHSKLLDVVHGSASLRIRSKCLPPRGGVYAFWWTGPRELLRSKACNRRLNLHGPRGRSVRLEIDDEWLGLATDLPVPLYVGKNANRIARRVGQHLLLGTSGRVLPSVLGPQRPKAPTTSCQLRAGVEMLFLRDKRPLDLILENIGLSYVELDGDDHAANRFYLEDLAIGLMRPPINVDVER